MDANSQRWAAHLLRRAGFGGTPDEIDTYAALGYEAAVERLLHPDASDDSATDALLATLGAGLDPAHRLADGQLLWVARMILTRRPLREKMTLFWHNHFATSVAKANPMVLVYKQVDQFRTLGLGGYQTLLATIARDPAMIIWLDGLSNVRQHPNENWGRELMELFTLGIGNYSEQDVKEVARAFTGWGMNSASYQFEYHAWAHDTGAKTIFGRTGNWGGDDVLGMLVPRIETGKLLARKLWRWFISETPSEVGVTDLARVYLNSGYDITALLRALLLSDAFRAEANYFSVVKNPVELAVGMAKSLGLTSPAFLTGGTSLSNLRLLVEMLTWMGMPLYNPPDVGGWPGGRQWLNATTYFARVGLAGRLLLLSDGPRLVADSGLLLGNATTPDAVVERLLAAFVGGAAPPAMRPALLDFAGHTLDSVKVRGLTYLILSSPSYQLN